MINEATQRSLQTSMNGVRAGAPPELAGAIGAMDEFVRLADDTVDAAALAKFGRAIEFITTIRARAWEIQQTADSDVLGKFLHRKAAMLSGLVVLALAELPTEVIQKQMARLEADVTSSNAAIHSRRAAAEQQEAARRKADLAEKFRRMPVQQIVRDIESNGTKLSLDEDGKIVAHGHLDHGGRMAVEQKRSEVVDFLRARQTPCAVI